VCPITINASLRTRAMITIQKKEVRAWAHQRLCLLSALAGTGGLLVVALVMRGIRPAGQT
jgi:hypothetical protein